MAGKKPPPWIAAATANAKGQLRRTLGAKPGQPIPARKLAAAANKGGVTGQRARLAQNLRALSKKR